MDGWQLLCEYHGEWFTGVLSKLTPNGAKIDFTDGTTCLVYYHQIATRVKRKQESSPPATPAKKKAAAQNLTTATKRAAASASAASAAESSTKSARKVKFKKQPASEGDRQVWVATQTIADGEPTILGLFDCEEAAVEACKKCAKQIMKVYVDPPQDEGPLKRAFPQSESFFEMLFQTPLPWKQHDDVDNIVTTISCKGPHIVQSDA